VHLNFLSKLNFKAIVTEEANTATADTCETNIEWFTSLKNHDAELLLCFNCCVLIAETLYNVIRLF